METIIENALWMPYNSFLAIIVVIFGYFGFRKKLDLFRVVMILLWFFFLPNTIYVLTDITHFFGQYYEVPTFLLPVLAFQYVFLFGIGIFTYFASMYMFEQFLVHSRFIKNKHWSPFVIILGVNLLIGIGVMMGRIQRTNSWEVITNPFRVLVDLSYVLTTYEIVVFIIPFWLLSTAMYYLLKRVVVLHS